MTNESTQTTIGPESRRLSTPGHSAKRNRPEDTALRTTSDYEQLPEGSPYQLIGGRFVMTPAPSIAHQRISRKLTFILNQFVARKDMGEVFYAPIDVQFNDTNVYQPDIIFIHKDRRQIIGEMKIQGSPDLVIEILSPSTGYYDLREKRDVYEQSGVLEYWIVDPLRREIEVFVNHHHAFDLLRKCGPDQTLSSRVLEGLTLDPADIF